VEVLEGGEILEGVGSLAGEVGEFLVELVVLGLELLVGEAEVGGE
jgi:hypothetical protein